MAKVRFKPRDTFPLIMVAIRTDLLLVTFTTRLRSQDLAITDNSLFHPVKFALLL